MSGWPFLYPGSLFRTTKQPKSCVLVGYSNPDGTSLPNHVCYLFPMVALAGYPKQDPKLLVQLEPGWMPALSRGLYLLDGTLQPDHNGGLLPGMAAD